MLSSKPSTIVRNRSAISSTTTCRHRPGGEPLRSAAFAGVVELAGRVAGGRLADRDEHVEGRDDVDLLEHDLAVGADRREGEHAEHVVALRDQAGPGLGLRGPAQDPGHRGLVDAGGEHRLATSARRDRRDRSTVVRPPRTGNATRPGTPRLADVRPRRRRAARPVDRVDLPAGPLAIAAAARRRRSRARAASIIARSFVWRAVVVGVVVDDLVDAAVAQQRRVVGGVAEAADRHALGEHLGVEPAAGPQHVVRARACRRRRAGRGRSRRARSAGECRYASRVAVSVPLCDERAATAGRRSVGSRSEMRRSARARPRAARARGRPCAAAARRSRAARR